MIRNARFSKGNALFIVLITVALFAALSYAVSSTFRGGTSTITDEQARISAGELLRSMQSIKEGYQYLWTQKNCPMDEISFKREGKEISTEDYDADSPTGDFTCHIFHPEGAGVAYPENLEQYQNKAMAVAAGNEAHLGKFHFVYARNASTHTVENVGTDDPDHMIHLNFVNDNICMALNRLLEYGFTSIPVDEAPTIGDDNPDLAGKTAACRKKAGNVQIYMVTLEL